MLRRASFGQAVLKTRIIALRCFTHNYDEIVSAKKCVVFMKGTPDAPQVGANNAV